MITLQPRPSLVLALGLAAPLVPGRLAGQVPAVARLEVSPRQLTLDRLGTARLRATAYDSAGRPVSVPLVFFSTARRSVSVDSTGLVTAHQAGEFQVVVGAAVGPGGGFVRSQATVTVR